MLWKIINISQAQRSTSKKYSEESVNNLDYTEEFYWLNACMESINC